MSVLKIKNSQGNWEDIPAIRGEAGPKGDTGNTGPAGPTGQNGQDGFSPIASVSQSGDTTTISITDKTETTIATIDTSSKLNTNKVKSSYSTTSGDVYDVSYINSTIGDIESLLSAI